MLQRTAYRIAVVGLLMAQSHFSTGWLVQAAVQDEPKKWAADDWNREWFEDRAQQDAFFGGLKQAAAQNPELHESVMLINDLVTGQPLGATGQRLGGLAGELGLLANEDFRTELDISDGQYAEMQTRQSEWVEQIRRELKSADGGNLAEVLERLKNRQGDARQAMEAILLPPQRRRLQQALWEQQLRRRSLAMLLSEPPLKETLRITDRQADQLLEMEAKLDQELAEEFARLQTAARQKLLGQLTAAQQSEVERLLGDAWRVKPLAKSLDRRKSTAGSAEPNK